MMEPSEAKAERERLILRRKELLNGVHAGRNSWSEFHQPRNRGPGSQNRGERQRQRLEFALSSAG